jgi:uncharacterized membrane protein YphA (DoxX/SURF4 family)
MVPQLQKEESISAPETLPQWSLSTRIAFRFTVAYFLLWVYPRAVGSLGKNIQYSNPLRTMWHAVVPWVGTHILHLSGDLTEVANGSGDQLYDYVLIFCIAVAAALITVIWSILDRKRTNYNTLHQWVRFFMRIVLTVAMISYGCNKLWWAQFPAPKLARLVEPYGQTQPADLLWTFMGMSRAYSLFGGLGELLGGLLLMVPRLVTLGALVTAAVMTNVFMLNMGYDVPRKIYCIHLIAMCIFLMLPDMRRLMNFFVLNREARLTKPVSLLQDPLFNRGVFILYIAIAAGAFYDQGVFSYKTAQAAMAKLPAPVRGVWRVDEFTEDGVTRIPLVTDSERWRRVILDSPFTFEIQPMEGPIHRYAMVADTTKNIVVLAKPDDTTRQYTFSYTFLSPDSMVLQGTLNRHAVVARLSRVDLSDPVNFALTNRGFHWVTQYMHWINQFENWR